MLLERLGPNLAELGMSLPRLLETIAATLQSFWRPVARDVALPTAREQAAWLAAYIESTWSELGQPCERTVIDRALEFCASRSDAFDDSRAVLVHGDAHGWNTLAAGDGQFKFVDPEGLRSEREHDLAIPMREYNEPLLDGDTKQLVRKRAELLARLCDADAQAVWEWGFIERVSTGLANLKEFTGGEGAAFLEVATRCL
jgi:streptomycin 6-kinase